jgi:hypothetical protein
MYVFPRFAHVTELFSNCRFIMVAAIALVFSVTPGARIVEARVPRLPSAVMTMAIEFMLVTSPMPSIESPVITVAPAMFIPAIVFGFGNRGQRRKHQRDPRKSRYYHCP